ncbi:hypothetical protein L596_012733 [Steinernema carpocapsae]|uniref:SCP domain-containing protein n=1 Tax=Steinernema carpocapsae TaxID=34508 RepID=A0A4U5NYV4_STECR|nr:hypothetical protein L596_012733 [Steinernema carpocapsae]
MAWAKTTKVGCGHARCSRMNLVVCNYRQTGNFLNQVTYEIGTPCTKDADCTKNSKCNVAYFPVYMPIYA